MAKACLALCALILLIPLASAQTACILASFLAAVCTDFTNCNLSVLLSTAGCGSTSLVVLDVTGGSTLTLNLASTISLYGLNVTTDSSSSVTVNLNGVVNLANNLAVTGNAIVKVGTGTVTNVGGTLEVDAKATLQVAGNVTVSTAATVYGALILAGTQSATTAQTAWVVAHEAAVYLIGSASSTSSASVTGSGGIDGSVNIQGYVYFGSANNYIYVTGDVDVNTAATMQLAGNLTVRGVAWVYGALMFAATTSASASTWLIVQSSSSVNVSGSSSAPGTVSGTGGIDGSVYVSDYAYFGASTAVYYFYITHNLQVAAEATLQLEGNVTVYGTATVYGTLYFAGTQAQTTTSYLVSRANSVSISGSASASATIRGNGGIDGSVVCSGNVTLAIGNSPGVLYISGDLDLDSSSTLELDVVSASNFDTYIIGATFNRNGVLYAHFENGYTPPPKTTFKFATHAGATGSFSNAHGNSYDTTYSKVSAQYSSTFTSFTYSGAGALAAPIVLIALCIFAFVIFN